MAIRAVVVDIDGTMTDYDRRIQVRGVEAVRAAEARGVPVLVATGNVIPVTKAFGNFVGTTGPSIAENGGVVFDATLERQTLLAHRAHADRAVAHLRRRGLDARYVWSDPWRVSEVALQLNLDEAQVKHALRGWKLDIVTTRFALHLMEPGVDKHAALRGALRLVQLTPRPRLDDVLAIGDSNNDVRMLRHAGASGAVANATEAAKAAAAYVARSKYGDGVKEILEHYGVI